MPLATSTLIELFYGIVWYQTSKNHPREREKERERERAGPANGDSTEW